MEFVVGIVALLIVVGGVIVATTMGKGASESADADALKSAEAQAEIERIPPPPGAPVVQVPSLIDPFNRETWPQGDRIWDLAHAIAVAEGYGAGQNVPTNFRNPGDLGPDDTGYPGEYHAGSTVSRIPTHEQGWQFLYGKLANIFAGKSRTYFPSMTFLNMAQKYAGNWQNWVINVTTELHRQGYTGVQPLTTLQSWYNS